MVWYVPERCTMYAYTYEYTYSFKIYRYAISSLPSDRMPLVATILGDRGNNVYGMFPNM